MRKKYLSALLFGALLFASAGTFTSCKDYDDDINNLQSQIDKLATKEDMEAKLSQMETAINDAKATAEEALKAAQEAGSADEIAKLEARIKALEDAALDVDALKKEIADSVEEQMADFREEMEELLKKVEELTGYSLDMITDITIVEGETIYQEILDSQLDLNYARVGIVTYPKNLAPLKTSGTSEGEKKDEVTSYEFGKGLTGAFTVKSGDVNTVSDKMVVNVNPANTTVTNDMVSLINGMGQNLNDYVTMTCSPYNNNIIKTRSTSETGLRQVTIQLKNDVDFETFDKLVLNSANHSQTGCTPDTKHDYIAYALAVTDADKSRTVTSTYDVTMHVLEEKPAEDINIASSITSSAISTQYNSESISKYLLGTDDNKCAPIVAGESFTIHAASANGGRIMASYVVVDFDNARLSATDKAALKGLTYSGVDVVSKDNVHSITINGTYVSGVAVPLKLVTIDYTGNVEVNMIWVKAAQPALMSVEYTLTPNAYVAKDTKWTADFGMEAFTIPTGATKYTMYFAPCESDHVASANVFNVANQTPIDYIALGNCLKLYKSDKTNVAGKAEDVRYAKFVGDLDLTAMREDKQYQGIVKFYDDNGTFLGSNNIFLTKKLPVGVPSDFSAKTYGIVDGVLTIYPTPDNAGKGKYFMKQAFNNWAPYFDLGIDGVTNTDPIKGQYTTDNTNKGDASTANINNIDANIINDRKAYASVITYNYGWVMFEPEGHGTTNPNPYKQTWNDFSTKFGCWVVDCEYKWSVEPVVYYREDQYIKGKITKNDKGTVTAFENVIKAITPYKATVDPFDANDPNWEPWANELNTNTPITLITVNESGEKVENEYFKASFKVVEEGGIKKNAIHLEPTGAEVKVGNDVETTVVIEVKDKFNHPSHKIEILKFTMKINHD
ncbi:hypothetical protein [Phocaeicola barnesiae]|uniref:Cell surface protein n=1 Tax=Phocaeicola barnesiae TaxID=376804 RepID=A0AAW5N0G2_9BACT|nr:hypothetical protein [Phocaeicola barnesiae]MCR8874096.1 hypothetical protein [Phocaeicola barnesiae]